MNSLKIMRDYAKEQVGYWQSYMRKHPHTDMNSHIKYAIRKLKGLM